MSKDKKMAPIAKSEAKRVRAKAQTETNKFRAIGPAAIAAALVFTRKVKPA